MTRTKQIWLATGILSGVFATGFLTGVSSARPLKQLFPTRAPAEDPRAEEFVQNFSTRLTQHLNLTDEQKPKIEEHIRQMAEEIRTVQRSFIPRITGSLTNAIDRIIPLLEEDQKQILEDQKRSIQANSPLSSGMRPKFGPPPGSAYRDGPPPQANSQ